MNPIVRLARALSAPRTRVVALLIAVVATVPAARATSSLYAHLRSDLEELLPPGSFAVRGVAALRQRMPGTQHLGIVVRGAHPGAPAAFAQALGERLRVFAAARSDLVRSVRTDVAAERRFIEQFGALYLRPDELAAVRARLAEHVTRERNRLNPLFVSVDDAPAAPFDTRDLEARARGSDPFAGRFPGDRLVSADGKVALVVVFLATADAGPRTLAPLLERVHADLASLSPARQGLEIGFAGDVAINVEELSALESDVAASAVLVMVAVLAAIVLTFRWVPSLLVLAIPVACGTLWGFALASLGLGAPGQPASLTGTTAFLGSIVLGNGINPGIMLLARHLELRRAGALPRDAIAGAVADTWTGTLAAAVAAAAGYAALLVTSFRGFSEFGMLGAAGSLCCWLATYLVMPPLLAVIDRADVFAKGRAAAAPRREWLAWLPRRAPRAVVAVVGVLVLGGLASAPFIDRGWIEYDMSRLRDRDSAVRGEAYWRAQMDAVMGQNFTGVVLMADTPANAAALGRAARDAATRPPLDRVISRVIAPDDLIPADETARRAELAAIVGLLTPGVRATLTEAETARLAPFLRAHAAPPLSADQIPELLAQGLREKDGRFGRSVLLTQSLDGSTWDGALTIAAAGVLRDLAGTITPPADVAGGFVVSAHILESLAREALPTTLTSFAAVVVVVLVLFRGRRAALWVNAAVLGGVALLLACVVALRLRINFLSFIAFPITFGIGVEYAINILQARARGGAPGNDALSGASTAVALCSFTTIVGYGSLLVARNQALRSFGVMAVLGELSCLVVAVIGLPAVFALLDRRRRHRSA